MFYTQQEISDKMAEITRNPVNDWANFTRNLYKGPLDKMKTVETGSGSEILVNTAIISQNWDVDEDSIDS